MSLLGLPNELLLQVAENLNCGKAVHSLLLTNRRLASLLPSLLLEYAFHDERYCITALYLAAAKADAKMIRLLLEKGENIRIRDNDDMRRDVNKGNLDQLLKLLLEQGAHSIIYDRFSGGTALHWAAKCGYEAVTRLLLEKGINVAAEDLYGRTALQWAALGGHVVIVRLLLENGADVNSKDYYSSTALHLAMGYDSDNFVPLLLEMGGTALHRATVTNNLGTAELLLEMGADYTLKDFGGYPPLGYVPDDGILDLVAALKILRAHY